MDVVASITTTLRRRCVRNWKRVHTMPGEISRRCDSSRFASRLLSEKVTLSALCRRGREAIAKLRLSTLTRSFGRDAVAFSPRRYLYNCKTRAGKNGVYLFRIHFARGAVRIQEVLDFSPAPAECYFSFVPYFLLPGDLRVLFARSVSFPRGFSPVVFPFFIPPVAVVAPRRQHLRRSSLFPLGCSEPFVMILRIHGGRDVPPPRIIPHSLKLFLRCPFNIAVGVGDSPETSLIHFALSYSPPDTLSRAMQHDLNFLNYVLARLPHMGKNIALAFLTPAVRLQRLLLIRNNNRFVCKTITRSRVKEY